MALAEKRQNEVDKFISGLKKIKKELDMDELVEEMQKPDVKNPVTNKKCKQYTEYKV